MFEVLVVNCIVNVRMKISYFLLHLEVTEL
jgi:hypothetical protein